MFRAAGEIVGKGGVSAVDSSDHQCVLFTHKFVSSPLALMNEVAVGELIAVKALVSTTV